MYVRLNMKHCPSASILWFKNQTRSENCLTMSCKFDMIPTAGININTVVKMKACGHSFGLQP